MVGKVAKFGVIAGAGFGLTFKQIGVYVPVRFGEGLGLLEKEVGMHPS
jgi:hypothetical protein